MGLHHDAAQSAFCATKLETQSGQVSPSQKPAVLFGASAHCGGFLTNQLLARIELVIRILSATPQSHLCSYSCVAIALPTAATAVIAVPFLVLRHTLNAVPCLASRPLVAFRIRKIACLCNLERLPGPPILRETRFEKEGHCNRGGTTSSHGKEGTLLVAPCPLHVLQIVVCFGEGDTHPQRSPHCHESPGGRS